MLIGSSGFRAVQDSDANRKQEQQHRYALHRFPPVTELQNPANTQKWWVVRDGRVADVSRYNMPDMAKRRSLYADRL